MKQYSKVFILSSLFAVLLFITQNSVNAQSIGSNFADVDTPIDGGVSILIAAGAAYGVKKIRDERKKKSDKLL